AAGELALVVGEGLGELRVGGGQPVGGAAVDPAFEQAAHRGAAGRPGRQPGQPVGGLGGGGRQAGQQLAGLLVGPAEQLPAGEGELGEDRHERAVQQHVDVDALVQQGQSGGGGGVQDR